MKQEIILFGTSLMFFSFLLLAYTFYFAYFTDDKKVVVNVNKFGEGDFEAYLLIPFFFIIGILSFILSIKGYKNGNVNRNSQ